MRKHEEDDLQEAFTTWIRMQHPTVCAFAIPNGGKRNLREAMRFKRQGVLPGVPDYFIAKQKDGCPGLFIEFKSKKGKTTAKQNLLISLLIDAGYKVIVLKDLHEAIQVVNDYLK